jgi:L-arabinose transport system substrate-binding protein
MGMLRVFQSRIQGPQRARSREEALKRILSGLLAAAAVFCATAVIAQHAPKISYIVKMGNDEWFINEVAGAKAEADSLGVSFTSENVKLDADLAVVAVDTAIANGAQGIVIVVPEQKIGPAILKKAAEAGVPVIAVDDNIADEAGVEAPFVGFSGVEVGKQVGHVIADFAEELGWKAGPETALYIAEVQTVSVCMDRTNNSVEVLKSRLGMTDDQILHIPSPDDNTLLSGSQALVAYPNVQKWMVIGCNDNFVLGVVRALEQAGYGVDDIIGVGINGDTACVEFAKPDPTGFRASIFVDSRVHGATAVRQLYDNITAGTAIPEKTIIAGQVITRDDNAVGCGS